MSRTNIFHTGSALRAKPKRSVSVIFLLMLISSASRAATIEVTAQIGEPGCDLVEAIDAANNDAPTGGCIANNGSFGDDLIVLNFTVPISEFVVSSVNNSDGGFSANGFPHITSNIRIQGRGSNRVTIKRFEGLLTPEFRFFEILPGASLSLDNIVLENGRQPGLIGLDGGAIRNEEGTLIVTNSDFRNNRAASGGAIRSTSFSETNLSNTTFSNNRSTGNLTGGGAIRSAGQLSIVDSEFSNNVSNSQGGALYLGLNSDTVLRTSLLRDNASDSSGGAIIVSSSPVVTVTARAAIYDTTISNNTAGSSNNTVGISSSGGGLAAIGTGLNISLTNTTITGNVANTGGGVNFFTFSDNGDSNLVVVNSIISGNSTPFIVSADELNFTPMVDTLTVRHSLIGHSGITTAQAITGSFEPANNIIATSDGDTPTALNAILLPLALNGGQTRTHALPRNSPAIDAAEEGRVVQFGFFTFYVPGCRGRELSAPTPLPLFRPDQRGLERPNGDACDIGAFEFEKDDSQCFVAKAANNNVVTFCL